MRIEKQRLANQRDYVLHTERYKENAKKRINLLKKDPMKHAEMKKQFKKYAQKGDQKWQRKYRLKKFNMTLMQYDEMLKAQNGKCYIRQCSSSARLELDHNHQTGQVRKLLCHNCNVALGHVRENITILQALIDYLKEHSEKAALDGQRDC